MQAQQLRTQLSPVEKSICSAALCLYGAVLRRSHLFVSVPSPLFLTNAAELIINAGHVVQLPGASAAWTREVCPRVLGRASWLFACCIICFVPRLAHTERLLQKLEQADRYARVICTNQVMGDIALDCFPGKIILPRGLLGFSSFVYLSGRIVRRYTQRKRKGTV